MDTTVSEDASLKGYRDAGSVQHYAQEAMLWAVATASFKGWEPIPWRPLARHPGHDGYDFVPDGNVTGKREMRF